MENDSRFTEIQFGAQKVNVITGGFYDRFRSNPDLAEVAKNPLAGNIDFFRRFPKIEMDSRIGPTWTPNFYYRASTVQLLYLAPLARIRRMLPQPLQPLSPLPGHGLVALTFFHYALCDNNPYGEVSVAVVIRRPGERGSHWRELAEAMRSESFHAHVLALPVDTEIARVRGVYGYHLPKWLAPIDLQIGKDVRASISAGGGSADLTLQAPLPRMEQVPSQSRIGTSTLINRVDGVWRQTTALSNKLNLGHETMPKYVRLERHGGPLTQLLNGLGANWLLRFDVIKDTQIVLHMPVPLAATPAAEW
ncbi:acetoacetate decarboxylase family protein [Paracoccus sp. S1E-3]|uniref:acetoacetate decarboxylase family protein n=1 Tax=Paracoccus sp. S1E-3 TaxID=2756130 RepID=UPI0015EF5089|nr:acetoacetate decarboxylase family protein [Paracoccus sp. S1E-3]MBA4491668.1 acetoacetate decarboxylase family protein [Paracoccus sp. S1E-3]